MRKFRTVWMLAIAALVLLTTAPAAAQDSEEAVVSLLTETVRLDDAGPQTGFWWQTPTSPSWTKTDEMLLERLEASNIDYFTPSDQSRISKIYRRPSLSLANASTLAELMGGDRLVVGHVVYEQADSIAPLGVAHVRADVTLTMTRAGKAAADVGQTLELTRDAYAESPEDALADARAQLVSAIAEAVVSSVSTGPGRVGWNAGERLIALRNVSRSTVLEDIKDFLEGLEGVSDVEVRWAGQGVIALEINPGAKDRPDTIEYAIRALANQTFDEFSLARQPRPVAEDLAEFLVSEPTQLERP
ncbi:MAG: hypothetical protein ACQEVA_05015 [Myxococcota bacterium]